MPYNDNGIIVSLLIRLEVQNSRQKFMHWISILGKLDGASKVCSIRKQAIVDWEHYSS